MVVESGCFIISPPPPPVEVNLITVVLVVTLLWGGSLGNMQQYHNYYFYYKVGDSVWSIPPTKDFYTNWSSSLSFHIGDTLVFEFDSELHDVMQVSRRDYDSCSTKHPLKTFTVGPAIVPLIEQGVFYFICSVSNYCALGQRLVVTVHRRSSDSVTTPSPALQISPRNRSQSLSLPLPPLTPPPLPPGNAFPSQASVTVWLGRPRSVYFGDNGVLGWACALCFLTFAVLGRAL